MVAHDQKKRLLLVARCGEMVAMVALHHTKLLVARCGEMASVAPLRVRPLHQSTETSCETNIYITTAKLGLLLFGNSELCCSR